MNLSRRGFLGSILALGAAPAIVRADSLMRIVPMETTLIAGELGSLARFDIIIGGALRVAHANAAFVASVNREWNEDFAHYRSTLRVRSPNRYTVRRP